MGFLLLRWKHWQCEELYADIDCHLLDALIMTLTLKTILRIVVTHLMMTLMPKTITTELLGVVVVLCCEVLVNT